jgi:hypothetical protein
VIPLGQFTPGVALASAATKATATRLMATSAAMCCGFRGFPSVAAEHARKGLPLPGLERGFELASGTPSIKDLS